jgi:preprotein translocase SecF subunit
MRLFENADYSLIPNRKVGYVISGTLLTISIVSLLVRGLALGIDFRGGYEFVVGNVQELETVDVRSALSGPLGSQPEVKTFGDTRLLIRTSVEEEGAETTEVQSTILSTIRQEFPGAEPEVEATSVVGPRFAEDLKRGAFYAVLGALGVIFLYILVRFEWRYSVGAVAALVHDVTITLGLFSILAGVVPFSLQIDQGIIAAFLTIVGYSLNDTVVVFDRVREYVNLFKTETFPNIVNKSINATLSRTVVTSITTLIVVTVLFVASPAVVELNRRLEQPA